MFRDLLITNSLGCPSSKEKYHHYTKRKPTNVRPPGDPTLAASADGTQPRIELRDKPEDQEQHGRDFHDSKYEQDRHQAGVHEQWHEPANAPGQYWAGFRIIDLAPKDFEAMQRYIENDAL